MKIREKLSLAGEWRFAMDPTHQAVSVCGGWYNYSLPERVKLPGSTASNMVGLESSVKDIDHFDNRYQYVGSAWYQRDVEIPEELDGKRIVLFMERSARTRVWIDKTFIGLNDRLQVPQRYDLGKMMYPGKHTLSIECDNSPVRPLQYGRAENGIAGDIYLEVTDQVWIEDIKLTTDVGLQRVFVSVWIGNGSGLPVEGRFCVHTRANNGRHELTDKWVDYQINMRDTVKQIDFELYLGDSMQTWDEFTPVVYEIGLELFGRTVRSAEYEYSDSRSISFGMREFRADNTQISVNGKKSFLRGTLATDTLFGEEKDLYTVWKEKLAVYKEYGLNHLRFHSSCPCEDVFRAADEMGFYIQVELEMWADIAAPDSEAYEPMLEPALKRHGEYLIKEYGNHPSFCMMSLGNEHGGYRETLENVVSHLKSFDSARLYAQGSNIFLGDPSQSKDDDFWVTMKLHKGHYPARGSFSHADAPIGPIQDEVPNTRTDLSGSMKWSSIPVIGHEVGQYETSPNFDDIDEFPQEIVPGNLILFKRIMEEKGMLDLEKKFFKASGRLCLDCYRQELEMFARTRGIAGYQMLGLTDCLGQGSSLVGILNIFMKSKGMVTPEDWRKFCSPHILLMRMDKYTWSSNEEFWGTIQMANYGPDDIEKAIVLCRMSISGNIIWEKRLPEKDIPQGTLTDLGEVGIPLDKVQNPCAVQLQISIENTFWSNEYTIWVFPWESERPDVDGIYITDRMDNACRDILEKGGRVIMFPEGLSPDCFVEGFYASNFWSYEMFKNISLENGKTVMPGTLGLYINNGHPIFDEFPTEEYSQWHWWHIVQNSTPIILDHFSAEYRPIVQVIDNPMRCSRLGLIFEAKVGNGNLLICASRLQKCLFDPAAKRLYHCLVNYVSSDKFCPKDSLLPEQIDSFFC